MKFFVCAILLLAGTSLCIDTDLNESEKEFEAEFRKIYGDAESEKKAAAALAASEKQINEQNKLFLEGKATFFEELNENSDLPKDVFEEEKEGDLFTPDGRALGEVDLDESEWYTHPELERLYQTVNRAEIPKSHDGRSLGLITSVKNQESCGSCAAFAITGVHEACMLKGGARFNGLDLSEQYLIDCGYDGKKQKGCKGANSQTYGTFFAEKLKGQGVHEADYPYLNKNPKLTCPTGLSIYNSGAYVSKAFPDFHCSEEKLKTLVATYGAAVTSIYASDRSFNHYTQGVYNKCTNTSTNHAVLVAGYGTDETTGMDFWLIRNSWGPNWGNNGFIKMQRGVGMCGAGKKCYAAECTKTSGTISNPPVMPPATPVPAQLECDVTDLLGPINGRYTFTIDGNESKIDCLDGICQAAVAGPSNACMYICGKLECKK